MAEAPGVGTGHRTPSDEDLREVPRDTAGKEIRVGIFVILGLISAVVLIFLLTDPATLRGRYVLITRVDDAGGIRRGDPVQMRGVNIGRIHGFEMDATGGVNIQLEIEGQWAVPRDSYTQLAGAGLFGGRTMEVVAGRSAELSQSGDTIVGLGIEGGMLESAEALGQRADTVLHSIQSLLDKPTVSSIHNTAAGMETLVAELRTLANVQRRELALLTESLRGAARGVEAATASGPDIGRDMARAVSRADSAMLALGRTAETLDMTSSALGLILARFERGEGTLGRLSRDEDLYLNLNRAAESITALATDIRLNPKRYINIGIF